jgi:hypothetical protein
MPKWSSAASLALLYDEPGTIHRDVLDEIKYPVATIQGTVGAMV